MNRVWQVYDMLRKFLRYPFEGCFLAYDSLNHLTQGFRSDI
jgi:hypothetical protein